MHYDKDEALAEEYGLGVFPVLSTVTYLDESPRGGAPTLICNRAFHDDEEAPMMGALISHPRPGKHIAFDGRLLHGVPPTAELREDVSSPTDSLRVTLLVNVWINHRPRSVLSLTETNVKTLNDLWGTDTSADGMGVEVDVSTATRLPACIRHVGIADLDGGLQTLRVPFLADEDGNDTLVVQMQLPKDGAAVSSHASAAAEGTAVDDSTLSLTYDEAVAATLEPTFSAESDEEDEAGDNE